jgi:hypothetical protein
MNPSKGHVGVQAPALLPSEYQREKAMMHRYITAVVFTMESFQAVKLEVNRNYHQHLLTPLLRVIHEI